MNAVDLFSGCGGLSLGFSNAGFNILAAFDHWSPAVAVYRRNFKHPIFEVDLQQIEIERQIEGLNPQIIIGGPPCQDFSSAGKRDESLGRADLTIRFAEIVNEIRPQIFVMENVERITKSQALKNALSIFEKAGYAITTKLLDASYCGVPQARKRYFIVGHLGGQNNFLEYYLSSNLASKPMTVHDYLGTELSIEYYYRHPRSYQRRGIFSIHEPSPTIRGVNRPIPKTYIHHPGDPDINIENVRPLTSVERGWIQTFPKKFDWGDTKKGNLEQMIGNAVPPNLAYFVANAILEYLNDFKQNNVKSASTTTLQLF